MNNGCGQLGAIQTRGTCWFYSILNGFILSEDGQKILYNKLKEFYKKLKPAEKAYFDDGVNAPCPLGANLTKTKLIYFWKFIDQYLCFMSGPRALSLQAGKSANLLGAMSLQGTVAKQAQGAKGGFPQAEIGKILDHVGFSKDYYIKYASTPPKFHATRKPQFVVVMHDKVYQKTYMDEIPAGLLADPAYDVMCASLIIENTLANKSELHKSHAVAGFKCGGQGYIYDSNQRKIFKCKWWDRDEFIKVANNEVAKFYSFFKNGQINVHAYAFAIFARKGFTNEIAPACLMKYRAKTPNLHLNYTSPNLGRRLNNMTLFTWLKPAERVALKRRWARTEHRKVTYLNWGTMNALVNSAKNVNNGYRNLMTLKNSGYGVRNEDFKVFMNKLRAKFAKARKTYTFAEAKAHLNQFTKSSGVIRKHQYSLVWRGVPMAQRKVLMHWRNKGEWLANNAKPKSPSPVKPSRANQIRANFNKYWTGLTSENHQVLRNYIAAYKSPAKNSNALAAAKRNVNALKTAKARKEYRRKRAANLSQNNWMELTRYINRKNLDARFARSAKRAAKA